MDYKALGSLLSKNPHKLYTFSKIKLYYNRSGTYVYLGGVIEAKNKSAVVKDIAVKVVRKKDKAELLLDWSSFMIPVFQSVGGNAVTTSEIARPFKVDAGSLYPVFIEFASTNIQESNRLTEIYNMMAFELAGIMQPNITIDQAKYMLANSSNYQVFRDELLQNFYWKADDYVIELTITYNDTKTQRYKFKFSIDANEAAAFKGNIEKSLQCSVAEYSGKIHLTAPSAVHLTTCFLPDSQHHRFSVKASLPLSPLQRFGYLFYGV